VPLTPGTRLGDYEILAPIGAGGMDEVYRARDTKLGREVAIFYRDGDAVMAVDVVETEEGITLGDATKLFGFPLSARPSRPWSKPGWQWSPRGGIMRIQGLTAGVE